MEGDLQGTGSFDVRFKNTLPGRIVVFLVREQSDIEKLKAAEAFPIKHGFYAFYISKVLMETQKTKLVSVLPVDGKPRGLSHLGKTLHVEINKENGYIIKYFLSPITHEEEDFLKKHNSPIIIFNNEELKEAQNFLELDMAEEIGFAPSSSSTEDHSSLMDRSFHCEGEILTGMKITPSGLDDNEVDADNEEFQPCNGDKSSMIERMKTAMGLAPVPEKYAR